MKVKVSHRQFLALVYHDIFGYPLTGRQLVFWQIGGQQEPWHTVEKTGPFYHLLGKGTSVLRRMDRRQASRRKMEIAQKAARALSFIPTVKLVGVSGALAMSAAGSQDDIDLFIITRRNSLWISRLLALLVLTLLRQNLRRVGDRQVANKLCLNLWLDEQNLEFADRQEIYTAHEILQARVLFDRDAVYKRFLVENSWVARFFPRAFQARLKQAPTHHSSFITHHSSQLFSFLETPARWLQLLYMRRRRTREQTELGRALFHPVSCREFVLESFAARLAGLQFPLDKFLSLS